MVEVLLLLVALVFALNIGASGAAATMGQVYGGGALTRRATLLLAAPFLLAGAVLAGSEVAHTVGEGIISGQVITLNIALIVLVAALVPLFIANLIGVPLSTSEVTVGALVGVGLALGGMNLRMVALIALTWALLPLLTFLLAALIQWAFGHPLEHLMEKRERTWLRRGLALLLIVGGGYAAFAAGANNAANVIGPLVGSSALPMGWALLLGGLLMALGALALGGPVLETNGRKITPLTLPGGITVSFTTASMVLALSLVGMPVPLTQATTGAILGVGFAHRGVRVLQREVIKKIASVWLLAPAVAMALAYFLVIFFQGLQGDFFSLILIVALSSAMILAAVLLRGGGRVLLRGVARVSSAVATLGVHPSKESRREGPQRELVGVLQRHTHSETWDGD